MGLSVVMTMRGRLSANTTFATRGAKTPSAANTHILVMSFMLN